MIPEDDQGNGRTAGGLGPLFSGLIAATLIALTLLVAVALGMGEQQMIAQVEPSATVIAAPPIATPPPSATATSTFTPVPSPTLTPTFSPTISETDTATPGRTLTPEDTKAPTPSPTVCIKNLVGWGYTHIVKPGDTLWSIAAATGTTVPRLQYANCMGWSYVIHAGDKLYVPRPVVPPTRTPTPIPPPVIKAFTLDPPDQVIAGECVEIEWVVEGDVALITLLADTSTLVSNAPETGSHSDCPTVVGTRKYTLRAVGPDRSSQSTKSILVVDDSVPPTADFSGSPASGEEPLEVSFTALYTGIVTSFSWSFGDGGGSTKQNPTHTYATAGDYTVSLTVDGPGGSETETKTNYISVTEPAPPMAAFTGSPTSGEKPLAVRFTDDSTGVVIGWSWNFGDGGTSTGQNPSHTYAAVGDYTVSLTVTGPGGSDTETKTNYISVSDPPPPPVAAFSGSPTSGEDPLAVSFTDGSTGAVTSWSWSFGDGGTSTAQNPSHTYAAAGDYTVSLTVTGPGGSDTATRTSYIHVSEPAPAAAGAHGQAFLLVTTREPAIAVPPQVQERSLAT